MKFKLILDKSKEEEVVATVHQRSLLTDQIEQLVMQHTGADRIAAYTEDGIELLPIGQIECVTVLEGKTTVAKFHNKLIPEVPDVPKTGDESKTGLWGALALISLAGAGVTAYLAFGKKHRKENK